MSVEEWEKIKFDEFLPTELHYLYSLRDMRIFDSEQRLKRTNTWNDDEIPIDLFRKRKQITDLEKIHGNLLMIKHILTTRDVNKRFCTINLFMNGDAYRSIPERLGRCLVIMPGSISPQEAEYYKKNHPHLVVASNKKAWMAQDVWNQWCLVKNEIVKRARQCLKQEADEPHFNYIDKQPNHTSEDGLDYVVPQLENDGLYMRNYPAKSTLHSQPCDRHFGRAIQLKVVNN